MDETNHNSKINNEDDYLSLPKFNSFSLPPLEYTFPQYSQYPYKQINQDFIQNNLSIQNVGGGGSVSTTFQSKKNSEQIYHYDDEYNSNYDKAAHKDNNSDFLDLRLNDKVFD